MSKIEYAVEYSPSHPCASKCGNVLVHRRVVADHLGRKLLPFNKEQVHHKDGNPKNNELSNLQLLSPIDHHRIHAGWSKDKNGNWQKPCRDCQCVFPATKEFFYPKNSDQSPDGLRFSAKCKACEYKSVQQWRKQAREAGRCIACGAPSVTARLCLDHVVAEREGKRRRAHSKSRRTTRMSYKLEEAAA